MGTNATQIGLGVVVGPIGINNSNGSVQSTGRGTDLAIEGSGFARSDKGVAFTRDGSFSLDAQFSLVSSSSHKCSVAADPTTGTLDAKTDRRSSG